MKKNISSKLLLLSLLALFGCKAKKQLVAAHKPDTVVKTTDATAKAIVNTVPHLSPTQLSAMQATQINFTTLSAKAHAKISIDGSSNDVTLNIHIKRNQQIWISITALLGLEAARVLITPDSIKIINRLQGNYLKKPFSYIYQYTGKQVSYQTIEALIIGNAWPGTINDAAALDVINGSYILKGMLGDLTYQQTIGSNMKVGQIAVSGNNPSRFLEVTNGGALPVADLVIPAQINISSSAQSSKIEINLSYIKADFNTPLEFPFAVPARYPVVN